MRAFGHYLRASLHFAPARLTFRQSRIERVWWCDHLVKSPELKALTYTLDVAITLSETVLSLLPSDEVEATVLVNEILEQALLLNSEPPEHRLENRSDVQADLDLAREQIQTGRTVSHEEVLRWNSQHR